MSSIKCPHCGLVDFSSAGTCKRCHNVLSAFAESFSAYQPTAVIHQSKSVGRRSDNPLVTWAITIVLLITNASLSYAIARKSTTDVYETLGGTLGGILAWPIILLVI